MKKIFTLLAASILAVTSFAQDLAVYAPSYSDFAVKGIPYTVYFNLLNVDTVDYSSDSTFIYGLYVNGNPALGYSNSFPNDLQPNYYYGLYDISLPASYTDTMTVVGDSFQVCLIVFPDGDNNPANDGFCDSIAWNTDPISIDLGGVDIEAYSNGAQITSPISGTVPTIDSVVVSIENYGTTDLPIGYEINYEVSLGTNSVPFVGTLRSSSLAQGTTSTRIITAPTLSSLTFPSSGQTDLCITTNDSNDVDNSNDSYCTTFDITTSSVNDLANNESIKAYFSGENLNLNIATSQSGMSKVSIVNVSGQEVFASRINLQGTNSLESYSIPTSGLASGIYFVKLEDKAVKVFK